jgi:hypothetical protein
MGQLVETEKKEMSGDVACLDVGPVPEGRQRSRFLAVGSYDNTVASIRKKRKEKRKVYAFHNRSLLRWQPGG